VETKLALELIKDDLRGTKGRCKKCKRGTQAHSVEKGIKHRPRVGERLVKPSCELCEQAVEGKIRRVKPTKIHISDRSRLFLSTALEGNGKSSA